MTKQLLSFVLVGLVLTAVPQTSSADLMVDSFESTDDEVAQANRGFRFTVAVDTVITGLAVFDLDVLGLPFAIDVSLYSDDTFTTHRELTIGAGTASPLHPESPGPYVSTGVDAVPLHGYRFELFSDHSMADFTLLAGTFYRIGANYYDPGNGGTGQTADSEFLQTLLDLDLNDNFTLFDDGGSAYPDQPTSGQLSGGPHFGLTASNVSNDNLAPSFAAGGDIIGPSVVFGSTAAPTVPEPSSFLMLGTAIVGALAYRRRRKVA